MLVAGGSITGVGSRFQLFRINNLEMVDQNSGSWNQLVDFLSQVDRLREPASRPSGHATAAPR